MLYAEYDFTQVTQYKKSAESKQAQGRRRWVEKLYNQIVYMMASSYKCQLLFFSGCTVEGAVFQSFLAAVRP